MTLRAYFFLGGKPGSAGLVPVLRDVPQSNATAAAAMNALLAGPTARESAASPAVTTMIPAGTRLLGLSIEDRVAAVDLSGEFEAAGSSASCLGRLGQVVFTLTQLANVSSVDFRLDGRPVYAFGCGGIVLDRPVGRLTDGAGQTMFEEILPAIFVDRPAWGAALPNPGAVRGTSNVFEAQFNVTLLDASGRTIFEDGVQAACGSGCRGDFQLVDDATLMNGVSKPEWGTLRVWDGSERDGSSILVRDYPVWLLPAVETCGC
jgi:hypothetical protein